MNEDLFYSVISLRTCYNYRLNKKTDDRKKQWHHTNESEKSANKSAEN